MLATLRTYILKEKTKTEKNKKESKLKGLLCKGCQGFCKKYYLSKRNYLPKKKAKCGDFLQNLYNLDSLMWVVCANSPKFATFFYLRLVNHPDDFNLQYNYLTV